MSHYIHAVQRRQGPKEAKSQDTKARQQSPVHPEAPNQRRHIGVNVSRPR